MSRQINGLWDMGRPRVPPLPAAIQMQDRTTGAWFQLSQSGSPGSLTLDITANLWTKPDVVSFGPYAGPYLRTGDGRPVRLYVDNGALAGEFYAGPVLQSPRVLTRKGWQRILLELTLPAGWQPGDPFDTTEIDLGGHNV